MDSILFCVENGYLNNVSWKNTLTDVNHYNYEYVFMFTMLILVDEHTFRLYWLCLYTSYTFAVMMLRINYVKFTTHGILAALCFHSFQVFCSFWKRYANSYHKSIMRLLHTNIISINYFRYSNHHIIMGGFT